MEVSAAVDRGRWPLGKAVDKLGGNRTSPLCADSPRPGASNCAIGRCGLNRSSLSMSSASMVPVEKIGSGFPQVGGADLSEIPYPVDPEIWKRSYKLSCDPLWTITEAWVADLYWFVGCDSLLRCFRPGSVAPACGYRKAC